METDWLQQAVAFGTETALEVGRQAEPPFPWWAPLGVFAASFVGEACVGDDRTQQILAGIADGSLRILQRQLGAPRKVS